VPRELLENGGRRRGQQRRRRIRQDRPRGGGHQRVIIDGAIGRSGDLPKQLLVHGWIKVGEHKMSKSRGNLVDPMELLPIYSADPVRYYLMPKMAINHDSSFSISDLEQTITSDLANDLGNLLNRLTTLVHKQGVTQVRMEGALNTKTQHLYDQARATMSEYAQHMADLYVHLALARLWQFVGSVNAYFHEHEPWKLFKTDRAAYEQCMAACAQSLRLIAHAAWPIMPEKMEELLRAFSLHVQADEQLPEKLLDWSASMTIAPSPVLFNKYETKEEHMTEPIAEVEKKETHITIDDFTKVDLRIGTIEQVESVAGSDKLLKLQVDFGPLGKRQILSGVAKHFSPEHLINKQALFVVNLAPRKMMGLESQGMMLLPEQPCLIQPEKQIDPGSKLK
jgi:methionyl-tRNA synthetase